MNNDVQFSLFDVAPVELPATPPAMPSNGPQPTTDPKVLQSFIHPRTKGQCIKTVRFFTGRIAVEVGPVEIEYAPHMIYIFADGRTAYTYSRDHAVDLDKFSEHFREAEP